VLNTDTYKLQVIAQSSNEDAYSQPLWRNGVCVCSHF